MPLRDIIGQEIAIQCLKNFLKKGAIPHAFLFHGHAGCGKHTTAIAFAQAINCPNSSDHDACGTCRTCRRIQRATDVDVLTFAPQKKEYLVEEVEPIRQGVFYTPNVAKRKVLILEKAEALSRETGNMLLKVLEEPPPSTIFILISDTPYHILPTIRSRAIPVPFRPLQPEELRTVLNRNAVKYDQEKFDAFYHLSEGSVGEFIKLTAQQQLPALLEEVKNYFETEILSPGNHLPTKAAEHLLSLASQFPVDKTETPAEKTRKEITKLLEALVFYMRGKVKNVTRSERKFDLMPNLCKVMELLLDAIGSIAGNANPLLTLEILCIRLRKIEPLAAAEAM